MSSNNPLTVEVTRGDMVESRHMGACVVVDADGGILHAWGDQDRVVYPRSAIKPLQALALVESGAADAYRVSDPEPALASAFFMVIPVLKISWAVWVDTPVKVEGPLTSKEPVT